MKYICNPMNIAYKYQFLRLFGQKHVYREAADPSIVLFKGEYYLFPSMLGGFLVSQDMADWQFFPYKNLPAHDYAPDVVVVGDYIYFCASNRDHDGMFFRCTDPKNEPFEEVSASFRFFDPKLFADDDGRVYFYWGCSDSTPISGVELSPEDLRQTGEVKSLISARPDICGYERMGENHVSKNNRKPYIEGVWMNKFADKYYLQYASNGTEFNVYADGLYESDNPLGPFNLAKNNPYSYQSAGFCTGAGHGSTFEDKYGNYWHLATIRISVGFMFERRLGLWPAGFDRDGELFCNQRYGDWIRPVPEIKADPWCEPEWMLLSYNKKMLASSHQRGHEPEKALDENIQTWWKASSHKPGEWIMIDLGEEMQVKAIQINFADDRLHLKKPRNAPLSGGEKHFGMVLLKRYIDMRQHVTRWKLEGSKNGIEFFLIEDKSNAATDLSHDLVVKKEGITCRFIKLTVLEVPLGQPATVSGLRVFGQAAVARPPKTSNVSAKRTSDFDMIVSFHAPAALGCIIMWGHEKEKLYHSVMVYGETKKEIKALVKGVKYFVQVDTFNEGGITRGDTIEVE